MCPVPSELTGQQVPTQSADLVCFALQLRVDKWTKVQKAPGTGTMDTYLDLNLIISAQATSRICFGILWRKTCTENLLPDLLDDLFKRPKLKYLQSDVYYSDYARFEHDPPGHTCGLPCCREDANVHLKQAPKAYSCMPAYEKILDDNFTFRRKRLGLIQGRPTFSNKFFSLQHNNSHEFYKQRQPLPDFQNGGHLVLESPFRLDSGSGYNKGEIICRRRICLPESPEITKRLSLSDCETGETLDFDDSDDPATIEYYASKTGELVKAPIIIDNRPISEETTTGGHDNTGYVHDLSDVADSVTSSEHYYDVLSVAGPEVPPSGRLYPDLSLLNNESFFSQFKQKYAKLLNRKKRKLKQQPLPNQPTKYDTFPRHVSHVTGKPIFVIGDPKLTSHLWNQSFEPPENYYEDIDIKQSSDVSCVNDVTTKNTFSSFGYNAAKASPRRLKNMETIHEVSVEQTAKRNVSFSDNPIIV